MCSGGDFLGTSTLYIKFGDGLSNIGSVTPWHGKVDIQSLTQTLNGYAGLW